MHFRLPSAAGSGFSNGEETNRTKRRQHQVPVQKRKDWPPCWLARLDGRVVTLGTKADNLN